MDDIVSNFLTNYQLNQHSYEELESQLESIMKGKLKNKNVGFIWQSRVKKAGSLEEKLRRAKKAYTSDADIFTDIRDLVAGRIILTRWDDFRIIADLVKEVFTVCILFPQELSYILQILDLRTRRQHLILHRFKINISTPKHRYHLP